MTSRRVLRIRFSTPYKILELSGGKEIVVNRWASVSRGDKVYRHGKSYFVRCRNGTAKIWPYYNRTDSFRIGESTLKIRVKEISNEEEYDAYSYLSSFHYRGKGYFGRRCILVMSSKEPLFPKVIGYVEVSSSFLVNKARDLILDSPFSDGNLKWKNWGYTTRLRKINAVVRISRVVVHPEFRGLDLGKKLIKHALVFSRSFWQLGKYKPVFVEITADMLKYVPFAEKAGMKFVGFTEGNLSRIKMDMRYLIERQRGRYKIKDRDIPDMQGKYATQALRILNGSSLNLETFLTKLGSVGKTDASPRVYSLLHNVVRFPKPTLMKGLTVNADSFLTRRLREVKVANPNHTDFAKRLQVEAISQQIRFTNVRLSYDSKIGATKRISAVQEAFGLEPNQLTSLVFDNLNFELQPGEILLVTGGSGSGKTAFLDLLTGKVRPSNYPDGSVSLPSNSRIGFLRPIPSEKPLIEYGALFGTEIDEAIYVLNVAGLSEPHLYLRRFSELSEGQKYRAMIARLLHSKCNIWVADDFLGKLDLITSSIVASNLQEFARKVGATVAVAAPNYDHFAKSLMPDRIMMKSFGSKWKVYSNDSSYPHKEELVELQAAG